MVQVAERVLRGWKSDPSSYARTYAVRPGELPRIDRTGAAGISVPVPGVFRSPGSLRRTEKRRSRSWQVHFETMRLSRTALRIPQP